MDESHIRLVVYNPNDETREQSYRFFIKFLENKNSSNKWGFKLLQQLYHQEVEEILDFESEDVIDEDWNKMIGDIKKYFDDLTGDCMFDCAVIDNDPEQPVKRYYSYNKLIELTKASVSGLNL